VECPFCGSEMETGVVTISMPHPLWTAVMWKSRREGAEPMVLMKPGMVRRRRRDASYCYGCDAVVFHPLPPDWQS
jgi:uncharacterized protein DUF6487